MSECTSFNIFLDYFFFNLLHGVRINLPTQHAEQPFKPTVVFSNLRTNSFRASFSIVRLLAKPFMPHVYIFNYHVECIFIIFLSLGSQYCLEYINFPYNKPFAISELSFVLSLESAVLIRDSDTLLKLRNHSLYLYTRSGSVSCGAIS